MIKIIKTTSTFNDKKWIDTLHDCECVGTRAEVKCDVGIIINTYWPCNVKVLWGIC